MKSSLYNLMAEQKGYATLDNLVADAMVEGVKAEGMKLRKGLISLNS